MIKFLVFIVVSIGIILFSRRSLRDNKTHGFYRFFAFEFILILILMNINSWFRNPFGFIHIISWILLFASIFPAAYGFYLLRMIGKPQGIVESSSNLGFENTTKLVTVGVYKYIRHPLYSSLLLLAWGIYLKKPSVVSTLLILLTTLFLSATAKVEETENIRMFGDAYIEYIRKTKKFIPYLL